VRGLSGGFTAEQVRRYSRHILLPDLGGRGQAQLLAGAAGVVIDGPAGRVALAYLVAAGVGTLWLEGDLDRPVGPADAVFPLALADVGRGLAAALVAALDGVNPDVRLTRECPVLRTGDTRFAGAQDLDTAGNPTSPCPVFRTGDTLSVAGDGPLSLAEALARGAAAAVHVLVGLAT